MREGGRENGRRILHWIKKRRDREFIPIYQTIQRAFDASAFFHEDTYELPQKSRWVKLKVARDLDGMLVARDFISFHLEPSF
jgi:hypothetical protein